MISAEMGRRSDPRRTRRSHAAAVRNSPCGCAIPGLLCLGVLLGCGIGAPSCPPRDLGGTLVFSQTFLPSGPVTCDASSCPSPTERIVISRLRTGVLQDLTSGADAESPSWSPDGRR